MKFLGFLLVFFISIFPALICIIKIKKIKQKIKKIEKEIGYELN